jgi:hypothetical protein
MSYGPSPMMEQLHISVPTFKDAVVHSLWVFLKGLIFGFFLALFYDFFACVFAKCCKKSDGRCCCGGSTAEKNDAGR